MIYYKIPETLVRVGIFNKSLEDTVKKFREPLINVKLGLGNTVKYATFNETEGPYLLMVSQQKDKLVAPLGYNVILTITSYSNLRNKELSDQFERETGINLNLEVPEQLKEQFSIMNMSFQVFEKNPKVAMGVLKGM